MYICICISACSLCGRSRGATRRVMAGALHAYLIAPFCPSVRASVCACMFHLSLVTHRCCFVGCVMYITPDHLGVHELLDRYQKCQVQIHD